MRAPTSSYMKLSISSNGLPYSLVGNGSNFAGNRDPSSTLNFLLGWKPYSRTSCTVFFCNFSNDSLVKGFTWVLFFDGGGRSGSESLFCGLKTSSSTLLSGPHGYDTGRRDLGDDTSSSSRLSCPVDADCGASCSGLDINSI